MPSSTEFVAMLSGISGALMTQSKAMPRQFICNRDLLTRIMISELRSWIR